MNSVDFSRYVEKSSVLCFTLDCPAKKFSLSQKTVVRCLAHVSPEMKGIVKGSFLMQSLPDFCSTI